MMNASEIAAVRRQSHVVLLGRMFKTTHPDFFMGKINRALTQ